VTSIEILCPGQKRARGCEVIFPKANPSLGLSPHFDQHQVFHSCYLESAAEAAPCGQNVDPLG
jgi:hypothetical protein